MWAYFQEKSTLYNNFFQEGVGLIFKSRSILGDYSIILVLQPSACTALYKNYSILQQQGGFQ